MKTNKIHHYLISYENPEKHFDALEEEYKTLEEVKKRYKELKKTKGVSDIHVFEAIEEE